MKPPSKRRRHHESADHKTIQGQGPAAPEKDAAQSGGTGPQRRLRFTPIPYTNTSTLSTKKKDLETKFGGMTKRRCGNMEEMMKERAMLMEEICRMLSKLPVKDAVELYVFLQGIQEIRSRFQHRLDQCDPLDREAYDKTLHTFLQERERFLFDAKHRLEVQGTLLDKEAPNDLPL